MIFSKDYIVYKKGASRRSLVASSLPGGASSARRSRSSTRAMSAACFALFTSLPEVH